MVRQPFVVGRGCAIPDISLLRKLDVRVGAGDQVSEMQQLSSSQ